ncbi:hypothetical protein NEOLEDRAFT_1195111, partial [Neolentinus lepideus HHB14362 ss-1]
MYPNGVDLSKLRLTEVLYSLEIGYTLISVGRLDEAGYSMMFGQGRCVIRDEDGEVISEIPRSSKGLYHVIHKSVEPEDEHANVAKEHVSIMELHRRMGHIAPEIA